MTTAPRIDAAMRPLPNTPARPGSYLGTDEQLLDHLVGLIGSEAAGPPALWLSFLSSDRELLPVALPLDDLPATPEAGDIAAVFEAAAEIISEELPSAQVVAAVVRANGGDYGMFERRWANALWTGADGAAVPLLAVAAVGESRARILERGRCTPLPA